jgi:hypothetical protein
MRFYVGLRKGKPVVRVSKVSLAFTLYNMIKRRLK